MLLVSVCYCQTENLTLLGHVKKQESQIYNGIIHK
jgi:hypothetical protein